MLFLREKKLYFSLLVIYVSYLKETKDHLAQYLNVYSRQSWARSKAGAGRSIPVLVMDTQLLKPPCPVHQNVHWRRLGWGAEPGIKSRHSDVECRHPNQHLDHCAKHQFSVLALGIYN